MFIKENWFAWFPVRVRTQSGPRWAWLEIVHRECVNTPAGCGDWRYYA